MLCYSMGSCNRWSCVQNNIFALFQDMFVSAGPRCLLTGTTVKWNICLWGLNSTEVSHHFPWTPSTPTPITAQLSPIWGARVGGGCVCSVMAVHGGATVGRDLTGYLWGERHSSTRQRMRRPGLHYGQRGDGDCIMLWYWVIAKPAQGAHYYREREREKEPPGMTQNKIRPNILFMMEVLRSCVLFLCYDYSYGSVPQF